MPYGYLDYDTTVSLLNKYSIDTNQYADVSIQNYVAGIDCRNLSDGDYRPQYLTYVLSIIALLMLFIVHLKKNYLKKK
jgi:hypothetical protein